MQRTKEWWAALNDEERSTLAYLERMDNKAPAGCGGLSDDLGDCPACGVPTRVFYGICDSCMTTLLKIKAKADKAVGRKWSG